MGGRRVIVSWDRLGGWIERFDARHPETAWQVTPTRVVAVSFDGTRVTFDVPCGPLAEASLTGLDRHLNTQWQIGVVLVRRGGFVVARLVGERVVDSKVSRRHVQGRTKAGGWSQQRFARRRDNQAKVAFDAAASHVETLLLPYVSNLDLLATGGDRRAVAAVLKTSSLAPLGHVRHRSLGLSGDPDRELLARAVRVARSVVVEITDPPS